MVPSLTAPHHSSPHYLQKDVCSSPPIYSGALPSFYIQNTTATISSSASTCPTSPFTLLFTPAIVLTSPTSPNLQLQPFTSQSYLAPLRGCDRSVHAGQYMVRLKPEHTFEQRRRTVESDFAIGNLLSEINAGFITKGLWPGAIAYNFDNVSDEVLRLIRKVRVWRKCIVLRRRRGLRWSDGLPRF